MALRVGDRVKHPTLHDQWGPGEVLAVTMDGKVTVHFALAGQKILKGVVLETLKGTSADHPALETRKSSTKGRRSSRSLDAMQESFLRLFPKGFSDPRYLEEERDYKLEATALLQGTLGQSELSDLLQAGDFNEITRRAMAVLSKTNMVSPGEKMDLKEGLVTDAQRESFARSFADLLYGSDEYRARFDAFSHMLEEVGANKWPLATYFPFIAFPKEHMFLKPELTKRAAQACNVDLNYRAQLNWWTYESLLKFSRTLEELISDLKPRDNIDLQSFMVCIGARM